MQIEGEKLKIECLKLALEMKGWINTVTGISEERSAEQVIKDAKKFYNWIIEEKK